MTTKEKKEWSLKELKEEYDDRQIRYIKEAINMKKKAYNKEWTMKEFPKL